MIHSFVPETDTTVYINYTPITFLKFKKKNLNKQRQGVRKASTLHSHEWCTMFHFTLFFYLFIRHIGQN